MPRSSALGTSNEKSKFTVPFSLKSIVWIKQIVVPCSEIQPSSSSWRVKFSDASDQAVVA